MTRDLLQETKQIFFSGTGPHVPPAKSGGSKNQGTTKGQVKGNESGNAKGQGKGKGSGKGAKGQGKGKGKPRETRSVSEENPEVSFKNDTEVI